MCSLLHLKPVGMRKGTLMAEEKRMELKRECEVENRDL
jgi:hypothetical protein